ncbi:Hypothetical predicted protein [Marmota monax]|uniref:Uncharacterized protein n=1 Tax=Marmota monax TaxID=9995 RepID=A0A5E4CT48_MARMO|nr:hypothetical protein GHT09_011024 [Marmota monax]VTJ84440.1 Hypothetical predicted protein [Marmota monax]
MSGVRAAPGDHLCCSSSHAATASAWRPDALHRRPRTSPGSVGRSRPLPQPSSRDPSSKSRLFACSLTAPEVTWKREAKGPGSLPAGSTDPRPCQTVRGRGERAFEAVCAGDARGLQRS